MVGPQVDGGAEDHLSDLHGGDGHHQDPGDSESHGAEGIIGVHEGVDSVVHHHEVAARAQVGGVGVPHIDERGDVVVPVQENQLLFSQHNKQGVAQLVDFGDGEHEGPEAGGPVEVRGVAEGEFPAVLTDDIHQLGDGADSSEDAEDAQNRTPQGKGLADFEARTFFHVVFPTEDEHHIKS